MSATAPADPVADALTPAPLAPRTDAEINPLLAAKAAKEAKRRAMLKAALEGLGRAEADVVKHKGVYPEGDLPGNIHTTIVFAVNGPCQGNVSACEWEELPIQNYGGGFPESAKRLFDASFEDAQMMLSCVVCSEDGDCTKPAGMATPVTKGLVDKTKRTRQYFADIAHEVADLEQRCRYKPPPLDTKLMHVRNQHPGLGTMWGVPGPLELPSRSSGPVRMLRGEAVDEYATENQELSAPGEQTA